MPPRSLRSAAAAAVVSLLVLSACGGDSDDGSAAAQDDGPPPAATVALRPVTFEPAKVTVQAGETVQWKWGGGVQHDVEGEGFKSKVQSKGTFSHTFDEPGTYDFVCNVHPTTMKGTVTVE